MIRVICNQNKILYSAYHLVKAFFPDREVTSLVEEQESPVKLTGEVEIGRIDSIRELYLKLQEITGRSLPWGMLTGVRPVKLASAWLLEQPEAGKSVQEAGTDIDSLIQGFADWFGSERFVSREKAELAMRVALKERAIYRELDVDGTSEDGWPLLSGYSLYIGIPFCPSVCSYCSFSSGAITEYEDRVDRYLEALFREMQQKQEALGEDRIEGLKSSTSGYPTTVYIGGGTPTSLNEERLERLLARADEIFRIPEGLSYGMIREYTVEAGRPDSITRGKLKILKSHGVTRISINPQSMQQKTLDAIGRFHTVEQVREAFALAREMGFDNINMDIIAGLPGETNEDMRDTLRQIEALRPDSLTVHSLAIKRASAMGIAEKTGKPSGPCSGLTGAGADISRMIEDASCAAAEMGMEPYYLYRQKSIAGNFENIGYAVPGREGLYNILIMEELQSIIGCGACASNKIVSEEPVPNPKRKGQMTYMIRSENVKNIDDYIAKFERAGENHA